MNYIIIYLPGFLKINVSNLVPLGIVSTTLQYNFELSSTLHEEASLVGAGLGLKYYKAGKYPTQRVIKKKCGKIT